MKSNFSIIGALALSIIIITITPAFADQHTTFQKILDVEKSDLQDILIDIRNYEKVFPDFVRSVDILERTEEKALAEFSIGFGVIPLQVKVEHNIVNENTHELNVVSGDLKGTQIITTLKKTWGFDGLPEKATVVDIDMSLKVSGFLALMGIVDENLVKYALDSSLFSLQEYSNGKFVEEVKPEKSVPKKRR
jgi:ribosome-associated toxin RatA of RatAB toxin-antitoxin module